MDDQATPYANAVTWIQQGVGHEEIVTRLKASGLSAGDIHLTLTAAVNHLRSQGKPVELREFAIPMDDATREQQASSGAGTGGGMNGSVLFGLALITIGVGVFFATEGQFIAYGAVIVGVIRVVRGLAR